MDETKEEYNKRKAKYTLERYHQRRAKILGLLGGKCVKCGSTQALQVDHVDKNTKLYDVSHITTHPWTKIMAEISKCQLLCKSCHIEKTRVDNHREVTHGKEWAALKLHCKCNLCLDFKKPTRKVPNSRKPSRPYEHGERRTYVTKKCRCELCKTANTEYMKYLRAKLL